MTDSAEATTLLEVTLAGDSSKIHVLQAGRAVAALLVVAHHAAQAVSTIVPSSGADSSTWGFCEYGYLGVDFFFVLSGFIIFHSTSVSTKRQTPARYFWSRANRIYTPYLPIGIAYAVLYTLLPAASQGNREWGWFTSLTLLPSGKDTALSVAWTLRHEVMFYAFFGIFLFSKKLNLGFVLWSVSIAVYVATSGEQETTHGALHQLLGPINLEFGFGYLAALVVIKGLRVPSVVSAVGAVSGTWLWIWFGANRSQSWIIGIALAFLILAGVQREKDRKLHVNRKLVLLGDASYSVYLIHPLVISVLSRVLTGRISCESTVILILVTASLIAGSIWHLLYERPVVEYFRRHIPIG